MTSYIGAVVKITELITYKGKEQRIWANPQGNVDLVSKTWGYNVNFY